MRSARLELGMKNRVNSGKIPRGQSGDGIATHDEQVQRHIQQWYSTIRSEKARHRVIG